MRKFKGIRYLFMFALVFMLIGCGSQDKVKDISFDAQYIRTDGNIQKIDSPVVQKIQSVEELNEYYSNHKDNYNFSDNSENSISFVTAIDKYDESYFEKNFLLIVLLEEDSSDIYHTIRSIYSDGKILIEKSKTDGDNQDKAEWHIVIEMAKEFSDIDYHVSFDLES